VGETLRTAGYTVLDAGDSAAALVLAAQANRKIHLVISDVVMLGPSGPETVEQVQASHPTARVLLISGYADRLLEGNHGIVAGTAFLGKPFTTDALLKKIRAVLAEGVGGLPTPETRG
jgi:two-component system, cell cycle sensor histidine kinase and response regulator CckA